MEALTRLVTESLVRHGFDRPTDYRRLQWSRWFRCESLHSLLYVPSKPGVFALAEEVADFSAHVETGASPACPEPSRRVQRSEASAPDHSPASTGSFETPDAQRLTPAPRRLLAVTQFFEDDDMAFVLDRILSRENPLRARLTSGRYFVRFVVVEDQTQRRSICAALNQWMTNSAEKATGIGGHFATSLELTPATEYIPQPDDRQQSLFDDANVGRTLLSATADSTDARVGINAHVETAASAVQRSEASGPSTVLGFSDATSIPTSPHLDSGAASNLHCPSPLPSGF
jgi:hypothetical protein